MSRVIALVVASALLAVSMTHAMAQPRGQVARCMDLIAVYERHVAKNAAHPLPSVSVEISVAIEACRQGRADGAVEKIEAALRAKGFRL